MDHDVLPVAVSRRKQSKVYRAVQEQHCAKTASETLLNESSSTAELHRTKSGAQDEADQTLSDFRDEKFLMMRTRHQDQGGHSFAPPATPFLLTQLEGLLHQWDVFDILTNVLCIQSQPNMQSVRCVDGDTVERTSVPKGRAATATHVLAGFGSGIISV